MSAPNLPAGPLPPNTVNESGIAEFSQKDEAQWRAEINGKWNNKFDPVGDLFGSIQHLINAVVAVFRGDWDPIRDLFDDVIEDFLDGTILTKILTGVTSGLTGVFATLAGLMGMRWAQVDEHDGEIRNISAAQVEANTRLDKLEDFAGTGVTTPLATSIGGKDIVTFPDSQMQVSRYADGNVSSATTTQVTAQANTPHVHGVNLFKSDTTRTSYAPAFTPGKSGIDFGFIRGGQDTDVPIEMLRIITGADSGPLGIDAWMLGIYVYDKDHARLAKIWDSGNLKDTLGSQRQRYNIATGLTDTKAKNDQLLAVATLQIAPGVFQTPRGVGCIFQTGISEPAGVVPQARAAYLTNQSALPQYVNLADLTWDKEKILWAGLGPLS